MSRGWSDASSAGSGFLSIDGEAMDKKEQSSALRAALEQHSALYQRSIDAVQHGPNIVREVRRLRDDDEDGKQNSVLGAELILTSNCIFLLHTLCLASLEVHPSFPLDPPF